MGLPGKPSLQDEVAFESAGKWFALAIDELNKHLGLWQSMGWPLAIVPDTQISKKGYRNGVSHSMLCLGPRMSIF
jgi:hypothetical protein